MTTTKRLVVYCIGVAALFGLVQAQSPEAMKPGPEHERLGYFVGTWTTDADMESNPWMPGGKMTSKDVCKWFDGDFAVVCRTEAKGPMGESTGISIWGYNPQEKVYTYYGVDSSGQTMSSVPKGTVDGKTWTFHDESPAPGGQIVKNRFTLVQESDTVYTFQWEVQGPDGNWMNIMKGKATKS